MMSANIDRAMDSGQTQFIRDMVTWIDIVCSITASHSQIISQRMIRKLSKFYDIRSPIVL